MTMALHEESRLKRMRHLSWVPMLVVTVARLSAQTAAPVTNAAATINAADVARHLNVIAADSMLGRDTPSRGLELTARYVADQFQRFGLKPGGDRGTWLQRYPIPDRSRVDFAASRVVFSAGGQQAVAAFTTAARLAVPMLPAQPSNLGVVAVTGRHSVQSLEQAAVRDKIVLYVAPIGADSVVQLEVINRLFRISKGLLILNIQDSATFTRRLERSLEQPVVTVGPRWAVTVRPEAVAGGLTAVLAAGGLDLARARVDSMPGVRELPALAVRLEHRFDGGPDTTTAPNTVGILEGSDPKLKHEYIVFSAHMDAVGLRSGGADSVVNGADDNASGTVGVLELAEAFSQPGARPRRSLIFLTVSGEETGHWGSRYFVAHPPVPLEQLVMNMNFDEIGRGQRDSTHVLVHVTGVDFSDLGTTLHRVHAAHPELRLKLFPEERMSSDHASFARKGVPILRFGGGQSPDEHLVTDSSEKIDTEREATVVRLAFYVGSEVANAAERPRWDAASYDRFVQP